MNGKGRVAIAGAAVLVLWGGFAYDVSKPAGYRAYERTMVQVAGSAHDAAQTGRLTGEQELAGNVTQLFARTSFDDAAKALAGAQKKFASQGPPDQRSAGLRDRLSPLLASAVVALGDTAEAPDDAALRDGVHRLDELAGKLDDFLKAYGQ
ncbi:hypothetical protein [Actinoplanes subtropicus]|uniref:hypothetical protein n=1 Tax=Actinoplanes subtropicus TaxID=543632 RepID=UPI0004C40FD3|nr:hypothetical protein [Actinoplanes subtropicus]